MLFPIQFTHGEAGKSSLHSFQVFVPMLVVGIEGRQLIAAEIIDTPYQSTQYRASGSTSC